MLYEFRQDIRYALRSLRSARLVAVATVLTLGIGIGLLTAIFSLVNAAVLRPLPYEDSRRLVALTETHPREYSSFSAMAPAAFAAVRERNRSFSAVAAYAQLSSNLVLAGGAAAISGADVSPELFPLLRVAPARGRVFTPDEATRDARVMLISHELWTTRLGSSEAVIGSTIRVDGTPYTVVGVMAPRFNFPARQHFWRPLVRRPDTVDWLDRSLGVVARLRDGVTVHAARADVATIGAAFAREHPATHEGWSMLVRDGMIERRDVPGPLPWMLVASGLFLLLIACANVATVLLARAASRRGEMAIRAALGGSRRRLIAQHLTETLLLAFGAAVAGVIIATWMLDVAWVAFPTQHIPTWLDFGVDWRVLVFTLGVSTIALLGVGVGPAMFATRVRLSDPLKAGSAGETASRRELRASRALVIGEVAAAFMLFAGAALMLQSFRRLRTIDLGMDGTHVLAASVRLSPTTYPTAASRVSYVDRAVNRMERLPGVRRVATHGELDSLFGAAWSSDSFRQRFTVVALSGDPSLADRRGRSELMRYVVSASYFDVVGLRPRRGRTFNDTDVDGAPRVAVLSESVADDLWPNADPLGRQFRFGASDQWIMVIGVMGNVRRLVGGPAGASVRPQPTVYLPATQASSRGDELLLLTTGDPLRLTPAVTRALTDIDPDQAITRLERLSDRLGQSASSVLGIGYAFGAIAAGALLLSTIGLYGVIAYSVTRRTREIGVRMALGADASVLRRAVLLQTLRLTSTGLVIGIAGAWGLIRLMSAFLYGVTTYDPVTYVSVTAMFFVLGAIASAVPGYRATRVDPLVALRAQ